MAPARIRRLLSRVAGAPRKILRGLGRRLGVRERYASLIQECSDDGTHSSEFTGVCNCEIFPTQVDSTWEEGALVAGRLPVSLGPREEVGDTCLSIYVHGDIPCGEQYLKLESDDKAEVVKVTPQDAQKDGPIVTTSAVYASHSEEDGYLGDGESSKDGESDDGTSNLGDRESRDGDSDDGTSNLGERDPADGEEHPTPPKYVSPNENLDLECNKVPQIQEESPKIKKLPASEQYNMLGYLNRQDQTDLYDSGALELLISKQSLPKDLQKLLNIPSSLSPPLTISPPLVPGQHTPPEKPPVRAPHRRKHQSSAKKISKKGNSKQRGKKQKKHHQRGSIISCGNSLSKAGSFGFASHSQGQSHTSNQGSDSVCIGQITRRKRRFQHQDGSSSSSGGKRSSGDSKSGIDSSSTSSDNHQPKKKKAKKKRHSQDKSSSKFEMSEDVSTNPANVKEDSSLAFVSGSELELSSKPEDKASDRESLSSFKAKQKSIKKRESGGSNSLSITESAKHSLPPTSIGDHQPADINELSPAAIGGLPLPGISNLPPTGIGDHHPGSLPPTGIGDHHPGSLPPTGIGDHQPSGLPPTGIGDHQPSGLPPTGIGDHQPGDLPPFWIPFRSLAEEEPVTQPLLWPSTLTHGLRALLVHDGIMPIQVHDGIMPIQVHQEPIEVFLEVCAVGDHQLLLGAVKVLGAVLYCKLCFINCGQPSMRILPAISVLCPEGCEWSLAVNVTACYAGTPETFRSFAMEIVRLLSILLVKWETFHTTEVILQTVERESLRLISLLQRVKSMIEGAFSQHDPIPLHLLHYLVERLLIPNM